MMNWNKKTNKKKKETQNHAVLQFLQNTKGAFCDMD